MCRASIPWHRRARHNTAPTLPLELETRVTKNFCDFAIETEMSIQPLPGASVFVKRYVRPC